MDTEKVQCEVCHKEFKNKLGLMGHMKTHEEKSMPPEKEEFVEINILPQEGAQDMVPVNHNGRQFHVKRNQWVKVPKVVADVLRDARVDTTKNVPNEAGGYNTVPYSYMRFPFSERPYKEPVEA